jgi:hypothetical protein
MLYQVLTSSVSRLPRRYWATAVGILHGLQYVSPVGVLTLTLMPLPSLGGVHFACSEAQNSSGVMPGD